MERWGDAPVHSLAAALFLRPEEMHWFRDVGYSHPPFQNCPVGGIDAAGEEGVGCDCDCNPREGTIPDTCIKALRRGVDPA